MRPTPFNPSLTLLPPLLSLQRAATESESAVEYGAVAGPLAGGRAPQRVSAPPSSDLATVPYRACEGRALAAAMPSSPAPVKRQRAYSSRATTVSAAAR